MENLSNLFDFNYNVQTINNNDEGNTPSRFSIVYGQGGQVIHTKKDSYHIVPTSSLSSIGTAFQDKGFEVKTFVHKKGEVIGLNINLGERQTKVGDKAYRAIITVPNNGGGKGYLTLKETRMVCTNGMVHTLSSDKGVIKIPHTINYEDSIQLMLTSLEQFRIILNEVEAQDLALDAATTKKSHAMKLLAKWFFENEMPESHKKDLTFDKFRELVYTNPEAIKSAERYEQLKDAFDTECGYNEELGLKMSKYTVYASITNYLSRRVESSKSVAPEEVKFQRASAKLEAFSLT